ncbi:homeobox-containing protein 1-like isoform X2 [Biomphalaria glabrata]|nr:homeobox-containing protein 1-like isoform X2 [Biomphalaria glabrata]
MHSSSSFTVEQIELIRRLRNSGITAEQILQVFQSYDRLDQELGDLYYLPENKSTQNFGHIKSAEVTKNPQSSQHLDHSRSNQIKIKSSTSIFYRPSSQESNQLVKSVESKTLPDKYIVFLLSQTKENLLGLMQRCLSSQTSSDLKQQVMELGVGDLHFHLFLSGELQSIGSNVRQKLLEWFVEKLKQTDWFLEEFPHLCSYQDALDVHFIPKRERFTFKEKHLYILELFFKRGQYPTQEEKEQIANECNVAMASEVNRELGEKEFMTHINVSNWFSNRRKEIKRLAKKDGIDTEKVILPSRVKTKGLNHSIINICDEDKYIATSANQHNVPYETHSEETDSSASLDSVNQSYSSLESAFSEKHLIDSFQFGISKQSITCPGNSIKTEPIE